jgi:hypothetical protein
VGGVALVVAVVTLAARLSVVIPETARDVVVEDLHDLGNEAIPLRASGPGDGR